MPRIRTVLLLCVVAALGVTGANAMAARDTGGNGAKACHGKGWGTLYTRAGAPFSGNAECTAYASGGGQLLTAPALVCLNGGWDGLGPDPNNFFTSEQQCVDFVLGGGSPVTPAADFSVAIIGAGEISSLVTVCNPGWRISVTNGGPSNAFVEIDIAIDGPISAFRTDEIGWSPPIRVVDDGTRLTLRTSRVIDAGETATFDTSACGDTGSVSVYSSSVPDPDSTPGNGFVAGEDDGVAISGSGPG
jgi:hypothetical protein